MMAFLKLFCSLGFLPIISFPLVSATHLAAAVKSNTYVYHSCSNATYLTKNDPFELNLEKLTSHLVSTTSDTGFSFGSFGEYPFKAYGHALCRGDSLEKTCNICVKKASKYIGERCPHDKKAIIWFEKCLMKYSDIGFFEHIDKEKRFAILSPIKYEILSPIKTQMKYERESRDFNQKTNNLLRRLANDASLNSRRFAVGKTMVKENLREVFGLAQCVSALRYVDCERCFNQSIAMLPSWFDSRMGAHIVSGNCILRYEMYQFV